VKIIVLASTKGGSGKSTIAQALAVEASKEGQAFIVDIDPQQSIARWWDRRNAPANPMLATVKKSLTLALETLRRNGAKPDWVIVDTPGSLVDKIEDAMAHADVVLAVIRPSLKDLEAQGALEDLIDKTGKRERTLYVVNAASKTDKLTKDTVEVAKDRAPSAPMLICNRIDFARADITGESAGETNKDAAKEVAALWAAVKRIAK
jgi:chromosome partitioning protein